MGAPKLVVSPYRRMAPQKHCPDRAFKPAYEYRLRYLDRHHRDLPHVVKFSGGRSSGMLLLVLLENGILDAERGDVIIFNNTSCEHPYTYDFVRKCRNYSADRGIPFFWVEFQTYEDARQGEWTRLPTYRLVSDTPWSLDNTDGFHWKGEVFEELLSWSGFVPNQFRRICTTNLKLEATRLFLRDWLACKEAIPRLGHFGDRPRANAGTMHSRHMHNRGAVPLPIYLEKKRYALSRPHVRPAQRYEDFSPVWQPIANKLLDGKSFGGQAAFGVDNVEYAAFVGLRRDEPLRVGRVRERNSGAEAAGHDGEHVYMPLADMHVGREDVNAFWNKQRWGLALDPDGSLSNCVYCFLKGASKLDAVHREIEKAKQTNSLPGFGSLTGTPCDLHWWQRMEKTYGRDLDAEKRKTRVELDFLGFFGANSRFSYEKLEKTNFAGKDGNVPELLPCECTE